MVLSTENIFAVVVARATVNSIPLVTCRPSINNSLFAPEVALTKTLPRLLSPIVSGRIQAVTVKGSRLSRTVALPQFITSSTPSKSRAITTRPYIQTTPRTQSPLLPSCHPLLHHHETTQIRLHHLLLSSRQ